MTLYSAHTHVIRVHSVRCLIKLINHFKNEFDNEKLALVKNLFLDKTQWENFGVFTKLSFRAFIQKLNNYSHENHHSRKMFS